MFGKNSRSCLRQMRASHGSNIATNTASVSDRAFGDIDPNFDNNTAFTTVTVHGRQRLERLLVTIPATADVVAPVEYRTLRHDYAARLLGYDHVDSAPTPG